MLKSAGPETGQKNKPKAKAAKPATKTSASPLDGVHAKLKVGGVNDPLEREADAMASSFMAGQQVAAPAGGSGGGGGGDGTVHRKCSGCEDEEMVQRKEAGGGGVKAGAASAVGRARGMSGRPLGAPLQTRFARGFGTSFEGVRVHTGSAAQSAASSIGARAFTAGKDVFFGAGQFAPGTRRGDRLLAHELAHVVQGGDVVRRAPLSGTEILQRILAGEFSTSLGLLEALQGVSTADLRLIESELESSLNVGPDPAASFSSSGVDAQTALLEVRSILAGSTSTIEHATCQRIPPKVGRSEWEQSLRVMELLEGSTMRIGESGDGVTLVQRALERWGCASVPSRQLLGKHGADGDFGPRTRAAVRVFQRAEGLGIDGIVGANTIARLTLTAVQEVQASFPPEVREETGAFSTDPVGPAITNRISLTGPDGSTRTFEIRAAVVGHASPRWRNAGSGEATERNRRLSRERAANVAELLPGILQPRLVGDTELSLSSIDVEHPAPASIADLGLGSAVTLVESGFQADANDEELRRADVFVSVTETSEGIREIPIQIQRRGPSQCEAQGHRLWSLSLVGAAGAGAGCVGVGGITGTLRKEPSGVSKSVKIALLGGSCSPLPVSLTASLPSPTEFQTEVPVNFSDFDGAPLDVVAASLTVLVGGSFTSVEFLTIDTHPRRIDSVGASFGGDVSFSATGGVMNVERVEPCDSRPSTFLEDDVRRIPFRDERRLHSTERVLFHTGDPQVSRDGIVRLEAMADGIRSSLR